MESLVVRYVHYGLVSLVCEVLVTEGLRTNNQHLMAREEEGSALLSRGLDL